MLMKLIAVISIAHLIGPAAAAATWEWDFTAAAPPAGTLRGQSTIRDGLNPAPLAKAKTCDFVPAAGRKIAPAGAFRFEAEFTLNDGEVDSPDYTLWDSLYKWDLKLTEARFHNGFLVFLRRTAEGFRPYVMLGFGGKSTAIPFPVTQFAPGETHQLTAEYNGRDSVTLKVGEKAFTRVVKPGGPIAPPAYMPVIGGRCDAYYHGFNGTIKRIAIIELEPAAE